jgi:hypothetical protein
LFTPFLLEAEKLASAGIYTLASIEGLSILPHRFVYILSPTSQDFMVDGWIGLARGEEILGGIEA